MFNIVSHQENINQNHNEVPLYISWDDYNNNNKMETKCWQGCGGIGTLLQCWRE